MSNIKICLRMFSSSDAPRFSRLGSLPGVKKEMLLERKIKVPALTFADYRAMGKASITSLFCFSLIK